MPRTPVLNYECDECGKTATTRVVRSTTTGSEIRPLPPGWANVHFRAHPIYDKAYICSQECAATRMLRLWADLKDPRFHMPEAPPYGGPRRWITCPECGSEDEASDTPCTNLACPSHERRGTRAEERAEEGIQ